MGQRAPRTGGHLATIEVCSARPEDAEAVLSVLRITQTETDNLARDAHAPLPSVAEERTFLAETLASPRNTFLAAFLDGKLVGTANLVGSSRPRLAHRASIGIAVEKHAWGHGIGTALMRELISFARNAGVETIDLEVRSDNERAIHLYQNLGFTRYARYEGFFKIDGEPIACDLMRLDLA